MFIIKLMTRRTALAIGAAIPAAAQEQGTAEMVAAHDTAVDDLLKRQTMDPASPWVGGIPDRYGLHNGGSAAGTVLNLMVCLLRPDSRHYRTRWCASG